MLIKSLHVKNFRNHENTRVELSPQTNIFVGQNAQGKTNLLEAIYLTCVGRGWRTNKDRDMIKFGTDNASVKAVVEKKYGTIGVEIGLFNQSKKSIKINEIPIQKMGELMGQINAVFFSPDELRLIKDAPADRRRFMDIDISQMNKTYFYSLLRYNKILAQRNALLKSTTEPVATGLEIWDEQLAKVAANIIDARLDFLSLLKLHVTKVHNFLTSGTEQIELNYATVTDTTEDILTIDKKADDIERLLLQKLKAAREKDMRQKTTTVGPHRDDIIIKIDGRDVRYFASQGQQRTVALSIKLAELEIFKNQTGEMPILLLDDVFSELDATRQAKLLEAIAKIQSIITTTSTENLPSAKVFKISNGKVDER